MKIINLLIMKESVGNEMKRYESKIQTDENGENFVDIPDELMEEMGWNEHTVLCSEWDEEKLQFRVIHRTEWSVEEAKENFDIIMDDVVNNEVTHIIEYDGRKYALSPYGETMDFLEKKEKEQKMFKEKVKQLRNDCNPETILELINNYYIINGFDISQEEALELIKEALIE